MSVQSLDRANRSSDTPLQDTRLIIFVVYSLGGLIIQDALHLSSSSAEAPS